MANIPEGYPFDPRETSQFEVFEAEKVHLYIQEMVSQEYPGLGNFSFRSLLLAHAKAMVLQLTGWCVAGRVPSRKETVTIRYPDGPWQALWEAYAPKWVRRKWPTRMKEEVVTTQTHHYFMCPHLLTQDRNTHVQFMMTAKKSANK